MIDTKDIAPRLQQWAATQDAPVRAAVAVLAEQGHWLRDRTFLDYCVNEDEFDGAVFIIWSDVQDLLDNEHLAGSSGEMAMLRFALFLARGPQGLSSLDSNNRALVVREFARALGVTR